MANRFLKFGNARPRARRGVLKSLITALSLIAPSLWLGGLTWFAGDLASMTVDDIEAADGIVVLTGGGQRITAALDLVAAGKGKRLLITGVNAETDNQSLRRVAGGHDRMFECCVDIDRQALNTAGNARQAALWARANGYRSLTVVTALYHMPRSLFEFARAMPDLEIAAFPVDAGNVGAGPWRSWTAARLTVLEYNKYLFSLLGARIFGASRRETAS